MYYNYYPVDNLNDVMINKKDRLQSTILYLFIPLGDTDIFSSCAIGLSLALLKICPSK